ncbi:cytidylate kinase-like family protein [Roseburia sp. MSJ-14]|uniref:cytidylate kinase-like family protein n=1 Tax=Roseburia sp. MSJ-14 TaxID=2841514 RepID=UPI001C118D2A|nr:cytidylate kinase-like family protein [Roseburia sp. MSJ-14]MBU5473123.1 cytidylate kinase-like family protein [Roseburia sp. MSJ-14]
MKRYAVTITRQFGSMGRPIARLIAEQLNINYYDRDIVEKTAKNLSIPVDTITEEEEKAKKTFFNMRYPLGMGTSDMQNQIFLEQQKIISRLADEESCIIVGRCSDYILRNMENAMHIYIYAPYADRLDNCINELMMSEEEAKKSIAEIDKARDSYHLNYAGYLPSKPETKDILISSSLYGYKGTAEFLVNAIKRRFEL